MPLIPTLRGRQIFEFETILVFEESSRTGLHRVTLSQKDKKRKSSRMLIFETLLFLV